MKKYSMRVLACFMACVIVFNVIAIPKAKASAAVVGTSALATSSLAAYMTATGVPLTVVSGGAAAASAGTASLISGYAAATGATYEVVTTAIATGATIGTGGAIILGAAAVAVLAGITAWAISEYGLSDSSATILDNTSIALDGESFSVYPSYDDFPSGVYPALPALYPNITYVTATGYSIVFGSDNSVHCYAPDGTKLYGGMNSIGGNDHRVYLFINGTSPAFFDYYTYNGNVLRNAFTWRLNSSMPISAEEVFGVVVSQSVTSSVVEGYEPLPELDPGKQLRIETGVSPELAPEAVPDAIFESIAGSTFSPTYTEEPVTSPEPNPDEGGETNPDDETGTNTSEDTGLLRRIAIACETLADKIFGAIDALADKITEGFAEIFAPDPALMQEISEAFTDKFGFVSTLHQLGTDLLSINATSAPPVVYIHLEDAEGSIYYGETVKALDMTWYARYKEDVDRIMSGFLWLGFLWLLFKRASAIIQGAEMATDYGVDVHDGYRIRGERNGKRF